jgi:hypothetical protein
MVTLFGFSDLIETCVGQNGFYGLHFTQCIHDQLPFCKDGVGEVCRPATGVRSAVQNIKTSRELELTPKWQTSQYWDSGNTGHTNLNVMPS